MKTININKWIYRLAALLLFLTGIGSSAFADTKLYVGNVSIAAGETKQIAVNLDTDESDIMLVEGTINLPTGLTFKASGTSRIESHVESSRASGFSVETDRTTGKFMYNTFGTSRVSAGTGAIFYITVVGNDPLGFTSGQITITGAKIRKGDKSYVDVSTPAATVTNSGGEGAGVSMSFSSNNISIAPGASHSVDVELSNPGKNVNGIQATLVLPTGWTATVSGSSRMTNEGNNTTILNSTGITGNTGTIFTVTLTAPSTFTGSAVISLKDIKATVNGVSTPISDLTLTANSTSGGSGSTDEVLMAFKETSVNAEPGATFNAEVTLSNTSAKVEGFSADVVLPEGWSFTATQGDRLTDLTTSGNRLLTFNTVSGTDGTIFTLALTSPANFTGTAAIKITNIKVTANGGTAKPADITLTVNAKDKTGYQNLKDQIADLQTKLDNAKAKIESECPDVDYSNTISTIQDQITKLGNDLDQAYADNTMDKNAVQTEINNISTAIDDMLKAATLEQTYKDLSKKVEDLQKKFDTTKEHILTNDKDVASKFTTTLNSIQQEITALGEELNKAYNDKAIDKSAIETKINNIEKEIDGLKKEADDAQADYEKNAKKEKDNEDAYKKWSDILNGLMEELNAKKLEIAKNYNSVYDSMKDDFDAIENDIKNLQAQLKQKYDKVELTASYTIDTSAISDAISKLTDTAKLKTAYNTLKENISEVQKELDDTKAYIEKYCTSGDYKSELSDLQQRINDLSTELENAYKAGNIKEADIQAKITKLSSDIAALKTKATQEQVGKQDISPEMTKLYQDWKEKITAVQLKLDNATRQIKKDYPEIAKDMEPQADEIQDKLSDITMKLDDLYFTQALKSSTTFDLASIEKSIEKLLSDAKKKHDDAIKDIYSKLKNEVSDIQKQFDEAKKSIAADCDEYVVALTETDAANIQKQIDHLLENLEAQNKVNQLTAESKLDQNSKSKIEEAIADLLLKAKKQQNIRSHEALLKEIDALQELLDSAKNDIAKTYGDSIASKLEKDFGDIQQLIDSKKAELEQQYVDLLLTKNSSIDKADVEEAIEKIKAKAKDKSEGKEDVGENENEEIYKALQKELDALQKELDAAKAAIDKAYDPEVAKAVKEELDNIQAMIDKLQADVDKQHADSTLNKDSSIEKEPILNAIEKTKADAKAKQNEVNYKTVSDLIAKLESQLAKAKEDIKTYDPDVYDEFNLQFGMLEKLIAEMKEQVESENKDGAVDTSVHKAVAEVISTNIRDLIAKADAAEVNYIANKRLTSELDKLQAKFDAEVDDIMKNCADVAGNYKAEMEEIQKMIDDLRDDLKKKYSSRELTSDSSIDTSAIEAAIAALSKKAHDDQAAGISSVVITESSNVYFDLNGNRIQQPKRGSVVILKMQNGKTKKMVVK
ncbi:MAG: hypothetical protein IJ059_01840 [Prevotella sp.]|nr:hypothetical protein [Prevotella sp.]